MVVRQKNSSFGLYAFNVLVVKQKTKMPAFDSLSFALLISFSICFILIFLVCCFADEIKDICRLPSPLPRSYVGFERTSSQTSRNSRRDRRRRSSQHRSTSSPEDAHNLILNEEGRSRNVSESSEISTTRQYARTNIVVDVVNEQPSTSFAHSRNTSSSVEQKASEQKPVFVPASCPATSTSNYHSNLTMSCHVKQDEKTSVEINPKSSGNNSGSSSRSPPNCFEIQNRNHPSINRNMSFPCALNLHLERSLNRTLSSDDFAAVESSEIRLNEQQSNHSGNRK